MASVPVVLAAALGAALFFTLIGAAVGRVTALWVPSANAAPALGWAVFTALALPLQLLIGFSVATTGALAGVAAVVAAAVLVRVRRDDEPPSLPWWAFALAAVVALPPLAGLLPKLTDAGIVLGPAASDHSKVAMIDAMTRLGLPAANPFFGAHGARGVLSYYYLWHFGAAQLSLLLGISGWEADAAMTGVTAYASLLLMMGLATRFATVFGGGRAAAIAIAGLLALTGTLRPILGGALGWQTYNHVFADYRDLESWMSQACWVPQHLAAANSALLVVLLLPALVTRRVVPTVVAGVVAAAAFGSSAWIGGVTLAAVAVGVGGAILWRATPSERRAFVVAAVAAIAVAAVVALPLLVAESATVAARQGGTPIALHPYEVLGDWLPHGVARTLDLPAFWLILLPLDLPAVYPVAVVALVAWFRARRPRDPRVVDLVLVAAIGLAVSWLLASTIGNNDLGWRAMLPPTLVLLPVAAAAIAAAIARRRHLAVAAAAVLVAVSLPERIALGNVLGRPSDDAEHFAEAPALWAAVRRHAGPADRVATNPLDLDDLTSFPVNIGWALLSDRSSCYSGWETAQVYVDLPKPAVRALDDRFVRVFAGEARPGDVAAMARDDGCKVAVVTDADGTWEKDPFARSGEFRLAEAAAGWRIYMRR